MKSLVFLIESFYSGSHAHWADCLKKYSAHNIRIFSLPGRHWKWRMAAAAISLAEKVNQETITPDTFLITGIIDLPLFKSLLHHRFQGIPHLLYMHENQLTYPWNEAEFRNRDRQYAWRNLTSMLVGDSVIFNSEFHRGSVLKSLPEFLKAFPDDLPPDLVNRIQNKSSVLYPGIDGEELVFSDDIITETPVILWNHRWEYDKNPETFYRLIKHLKSAGIDFKLVVCGEKYDRCPDVFNAIEKEFSSQIIHWGRFENRKDYFEIMSKCDLIPVTNVQEFFGLSVMEAIMSGVTPLLPNRLSYPELYSDLDCFYDSEKEFFERSAQILTNRIKLDFRSSLNRFIWSEQIGEYDKILRQKE
ncbi:MAG: DUF3524 domain-containing protein [Bacteroidetes bacterium]|nr:DUF3524 domain-containing protein [Bacteroidota bacterium]